MTRNKRLAKRIGCSLLAGTLAISSIVPDATVIINANSVINKDSTGTTLVYTPFGVTLRKLYKWCSYIDKTAYPTADKVYNHYVYGAQLMEENIYIGRDNEGNNWYGDCVILRFGAPNSYYDNVGFMPVIVNVRCPSSLTNIRTGTLPSGCTVTYNGEEVFAPAIEIGSYALENTSFETLYVPETYCNIADYAFYKCTSLTNIYFLNEDGSKNKGSNLCHIGNHAFEGCSSLQEAILPSQLLEASSNNGTDPETSYYYTNTYLKFGTNVYKDCTSLKDITIECTNALIPYQTFAGCSNIENISIKANKAIICHSAFSGAGANNLKNVTFDCDVRLGSYAFSDNTNLENVTFNGNVEFKEATSSSDNSDSVGVFSNCFSNTASTDTSINFNGSTEITIPERCLQGSNSLKKITINSKSVTCNSFAGVPEGTALTFGKNVSEISWGTSGTSAGNIKNIYITSPKTDIIDGIPDESYYLYGYLGKNYANYAKSCNNVMFQSYIYNLTINSSSPGQTTPTMFMSHGFDESKIEVIANNVDGTQDVLTYSEDGEYDGYTISESSKQFIASMPMDTEPSNVPICFCYCGLKFSESILFEPAKVISFDVALKKNLTLSAGTQLRAEYFDIKNILYNDGSIQAMLDSTDEVSVALAAGGTTLSKGNNTVLVSYNGCEEATDVTAVEKKIESISAVLNTPDNDGYYEGDTLTNDDFNVTVKYNNGDVIENFQDFTLSNNTIPKGTIGIYPVTISADGCSTQIDIVVQENQIKHILASYPSQTMPEGNVLDKNKVSVILLYSNGATRTLNTDEFDLVYTSITADTETEVKVILKEDTTKQTSFKIFGEAASKNDTIVTATPAPTLTAVPGTTPTVTVTPEHTATTVPVSTIRPTKIPTVEPTTAPTVTPSAAPIADSTAAPTAVPSAAPSIEPTTVPTVMPSAEPEAPKLTLKNNSISLGVNERIQIKATTTKGAKIIYTPKNANICRVTSKGIIIGKKAGTTQITVTVGNVKKKIKVHVWSKPTKVGLTKKMSNKVSYTLKKGKTKQLKIYFYKNSYSNKLTFTSSNKKIATVSSTGKIAAKKKGKCKITVKTYNGKKAIVTLKVK